MLSISSAGSTSSIPPVIIHLISGQKVSALSFLELSSFSDSLSAQVGMVTSSSFLSGGDLSVRPSDESQKDKLLACERHITEAQLVSEDINRTSYTRRHPAPTITSRNDDSIQYACVSSQT